MSRDLLGVNRGAVFPGMRNERHVLTAQFSEAGDLKNMAGEPILRLDKIGKTLGGTEILRDIDLSVAKGEVISIVGPSGSGKSTLLRCINYLTPPDRGRVIFDGEPVAAPGARPARDGLVRLRRNIGMVFQSFELFPHLTAIENITLAQRKVLGISREEARDRALELLGNVGLLEKAGSYPRHCSGGQQQRIAIARALAMRPQVMLFDEPTSALDPELGADVLAVMRDVVKAGMTMLVVTHEIGFAVEVSDRMIVMADGRVIEEGVPEQVVDRPAHDRAARFFSAIRGR